MKLALDHPLSQTARPVPLALRLAGQIADHRAAARAFGDYQQRRAANTRRQQAANLARLRAYLTASAADPGDLYQDPDAWTGITWGLVADFLQAELSAGFAVATLNSRLSTIKRYAGLALQAGRLPAEQYAMLRAVQGFSRKEGLHLDQQRLAAGLATRQGHKAASPILLSPDQVAALKQHHPDTPQGRRDRLMMYLFLEHGLRCGEMAAIQRAGLLEARGELHFYRPKVDRYGAHSVGAATLAVARRYLAVRGDQPGPLLWGSSKAGALLAGRGISSRAINSRVRELGRRLLGIANLGPHDCRHTLATDLARAGRDVRELMDIFGWSSPAMAMRYVAAARLARPSPD